MNQTNENHDPNADAKLLLGDVILSQIEEITGFDKKVIEKDEYLNAYGLDDFDLLEIIMNVERDLDKRIPDHFDSVGVYSSTVNDFIEWVSNNIA